jgi:hypothetical protein
MSGCKGAGVQGCKGARVPVLVLVLLVPLSSSAQDDPRDRIAAAVRTAMAPALPFPNSDADGALPANGNTEALWMVRPLQPGDRSIEVIANPLNEVNQARATRAMAQIENNVQAAQRRAALQYERAVSEAKRTGKSQEVDGVTLADEGVAGAKIDAESHVTIAIAANETSFTFEVESSTPPTPSTQVTIPGAIAVIAMPSNTYRERDTNIERYAEAQTFVFLGRVAVPEVQKRADNHFEVFATATAPSLVIRLRGNEALIADLLRKTNWNSLLELMR